MSNIYSGNAEQDGQDRRGWIVGEFIPEGVRHAGNVEIKYGVHEQGEARHDWVVGEERTALFVLISGKFAMQFRDQDVVLGEQGDYVMWGPGTDHKWEALEPTVGITVRWTEQ